MSNTLPLGLAPADCKWLDMRWSWLLSEFGAGVPRQAMIVLAEPEFFPDRYDYDRESAEKYLHRTCQYMGVDSSRVRLEVYDEGIDITQREHPETSAGAYVERDEHFEIWIEVKQLPEPKSLVATFAHELGHVRLLGEKRVTTDTVDHEWLTDLMTVFCGMGIFTANTVLEHSSWQDGIYAQWSMRRKGYLSMPMYGYALALFALERNDPQPMWSKYLRTDVKASFKQSMGLLLSSPKINSARYVDEAFLKEYVLHSNAASQLFANDSAADDPTSLDGKTTCGYCGKSVSPNEDVCAACQLSIAENATQLNAEREAQESGKRILQFFYTGPIIVTIGTMIVTIAFTIYAS